MASHFVANESAVTKIHHLNCGVLHVPPGPRASCHCLLIEGGEGLALVDTGIGWHDVARPLERIGQSLIDMAGFQFHEDLTAIRQVERLGFCASDVSDIVLTHGDPDHTGGLADFPTARVHIAVEEHDQVIAGAPRYVAAHFDHRPRWVTHAPSSRECDWYGLSARRVEFAGGPEILLVPLPGHTLGHCGVAIRQGDRWLLHVGDAYYLRVELTTDDHPVSALASLRAEDDAQRRTSLEHLRRLIHDHGEWIAMFGYHDFLEFAPDAAQAEKNA